jgi:uncharacterized protein
MLVDAGPLVALIHRGDRNHERCKKVASSLVGPLVTVWPAFTEAMYLLSFSWRAQDALWEMLHRAAVVFAELGESDFSRMRDLMKRYQDLPMDLADAALVRVAEREKLREIFTLDRKDFGIYRPSRSGRFRIVP